MSTADASTTETAAASRPRVAGDRELQILESAIDVLREVGYDRLTFDAVAAGARASKATLYRRWPANPDLRLGAGGRVLDGPAGQDPHTPRVLAAPVAH